MGNDGGGEVLTFSQKFFTDVETDQFRSRLPMTLDGFVSHIERTANATRGFEACSISQVTLNLPLLVASF